MRASALVEATATAPRSPINALSKRRKIYWAPGAAISLRNARARDIVMSLATAEAGMNAQRRAKNEKLHQIRY